MHYAGTRRSDTNPLRSTPLFRSAAALRPATQPTPAILSAHVSPWAPPSALTLQARELAAAEAALRDADHVLKAARAGVEEAKLKATPPIFSNGRVVVRSIPFTPERIRERKAQARRLLAKRLAGMAVARGRVEAARASLGMPSLVELEERAAQVAANGAARAAYRAQGVLTRAVG